MRLPFGKYTDIEILDTLEVVAHERYEELLRKAGVLNEAFVDYRTRAVLRTNAQGQQVVVTETTTGTSTPVTTNGGTSTGGTGGATGGEPELAGTAATPSVTTVEERSQKVEASAAKLKQEVARNAQAPAVSIPVLRMSVVESRFSLADITDTDAFRKLGASLAADPTGELSRTLVSARMVTGRDGLRRTELVTTDAADRLRSTPSLIPEEDLRARLAEVVLGSAAVPGRRDQRNALRPLLEAFFDGLGDKAVDVLSANLDRAGARLVRLVETEQRRFMAKPSYEEVVELRPFEPTRATDRITSANRHGAFATTTAHEGWQRSMFDLVWFDSSTERAVANTVDADSSVAWWVRLHIKDLPILWNSAGQEYNPDLIVIEKDDTRWVVEVKMDKEMTSTDVQAKRDAARRWANYVSADPAVGATWRYLLVSENDVATAKGSWFALKKLGT
jgi:type III restriction enzyme